MKQLNLFDLPEEATVLRAPVAAIPQEKWDAWWIELLCRPRDKWDDTDGDSVEPNDRLPSAKQEGIPGLV